MKFLLSCLLCGLPFFTFGKIMLPAIIADHMVLQQTQTVKIWGWTTNTSEQIQIQASWNQDTVKTRAARGYWEVELETPSYGGPYEIQILAHENITIKDVLIGEVWLASGQSNMEMPVDSVRRGFPGMVDYQAEIKAADYPEIRLFLVQKKKAYTPQDDLIGQWTTCTPTTVRNFSAVAYVFAEQIHKKLQVPVGMIASSWGGTNAETWIRKEYLESDAELSKSALERPANRNWPLLLGEAYNGMIYPLLKYSIKGALWYQGESNRPNAHQYAKVMEALIKNWREEWGNEFPFYFTQIAPYYYPNGVAGSYVREAQLKTLSVPKTGMVVTNDLGNITNIHPRRKREVGERLALWALANDYGQTNLVYSGPLFRSMEVKGSDATIHFDYAESGLVRRGIQLTGFEIAGGDQVFYPAEARIKGQKVVVNSAQVAKPVAVRFAFGDKMVHNLYNAAGLPASPFRTDNWTKE